MADERRGRKWRAYRVATGQAMFRFYLRLCVRAKKKRKKKMLAQNDNNQSQK